MIIDPKKLNRGAKRTKTIRLTEREIEAISHYQNVRWLEQSADLTFTAALREIIHSYDWDSLNEFDLAVSVR